MITPTARWPRRKRWEYWAVTSPRELVMVLVADVDYLGVALLSVLDVETGRRSEAVALRPLGIGCRVPDRAGGAPIRFRGLGLEIEIAPSPSQTRITASGRSWRGERLELDVEIAPCREPLDVLVPFSPERAHFTSKRVGLPATGRLRVGADARPLPDGAFATLDYGNGSFPFRTSWNWAAAAGSREGQSLAFNLGARWTDGTGVTENGFWIDGRLHRITEEVAFTREAGGWRIRSGSGRVDLAFEPLRHRDVGLDLGLIAARLDWTLGRFAGTLARDGAPSLTVDGLLGWAEALDARW